MGLATFVSYLSGWGYVIAWSTSLYPPILLNRRLRSVEGVSLDFLYMNALGYLTYAFSISLLYFNRKVRNEYSQRHKLTENGDLNFPLVRFNDVIYGYHGLFVAGFALYQVYFCNYTRGPGQRVGRATKFLYSVSLLSMLMLSIFAYFETKKGNARFQMLDVANILGNIKVLMSASKYIPQIFWNMRRQSTKGWSINGTLLDVLGSFLCLFQLVLDGYVHNSIGDVFNNPVKLSLPLVTLCFDVIFILQHYVLYRDDGMLSKGKKGILEMEDVRNH